MRTRLVTIAALSLVALTGVSSAAHAGPKGPGEISDKPTTTTTAAPKDKVAPTPTTQPPKGPGDISQPKPGDNPQPPKDKAPAPKGGGVEPGPDTTGNGSGPDNHTPTDNGGGLSPYVLLGFAILTAALIGFVVARRRGDEQDAEQV